MPPIRPLGDDERQRVRAALVVATARAEEQCASLMRQFDDIVRSAELSNADDEHDPEGATIAFERAQVSALLSQALRDRQSLRRSLARAGDEDFGRCEVCGGPIGAERLVALPMTSRCVECAR